MVVKVSLLLGSVLAVLPAIVSAGSCPPKYALIASTVAQLPQAQSYCSSKYPLPAVTSTVSASTSTSTIIVTTTVTSTAPAVTDTITQSTTGSVTTTVPVTSTSTVTVFTLTTSTFTSIIPPASPAPRMLEREAHNEPPVKASSTTTSCKTTSSQAANLKASVWSSLVSKATSIIPTICTCIETAKTTSITVTPSTTVTSTVIVTAVASPSTVFTTVQTTVATITARASTTVGTVTTTVTSTNTAVQTVYRFPSQVVCNANQNSYCENRGGFTTGVLPCTGCGIFYIEETPVCYGQIVNAGTCRNNDDCRRVGGASARCIFDPRPENYGSSICAITETCNRPS